MGPVEAAAMWRDGRLLNSQARIVLKHLRYHFESTITVPFEKMYSLVDGYTKPKVKVFDYHKEGEKIPEVVHAQYQDISREFARSVQELIVEYKISSKDIVGVFLVVGGDHGQGAFRLCFRALLTVRGRVHPVYKTKSIAEVYCKKEEGTLLDESIMPWLNSDLTKIKDSHLHAQQRVNNSENVVHDSRGAEWFVIGE